MLISAVIPTYKRPESLLRTLKSLDAQILKPDEIIIVSGEPDSPTNKLKIDFPMLNLKLFHSNPSVCLQRNKGIDIALGKYILLCDDDIELPSNYLSELTNFLEINSKKIIATGLVAELHNNNWEYEFKPKSFLSLLYKFIFCHGVWGSLDKIRSNWLTIPILKYYRQKGNTKSKAGWPLITQLNKPVFETLYYALGASVIRRTYLNEHKYDEILDKSGIGDNYGITINKLDLKQINVLMKVKAKHYKASQNRLAEPISYYRRIMAMDYFLRINGQKTLINYFALIWSVFGNLLSQTILGRFGLSIACIRALAWLVPKCNPYMK